MKKLLAIVVLGLLISTNVFAEKINSEIKNQILNNLPDDWLKIDKTIEFYKVENNLINMEVEGNFYDQNIIDLLANLTKIPSIDLPRLKLLGTSDLPNANRWFLIQISLKKK